jgi:DNA repair protein RecO (recombination protein O)
MERTSAILIRKQPLSDTSLIVTWMTEDFGKLRTAAKAARQPRSPFAGKLDLFYLSEICVVMSRRSSLHTLGEVAVREPFDASRVTYATISLCSYFAEIVDLATEPAHPSPEIYHLLLRAISYLRKNPASERALVHFEREFCKLLGVFRADTDLLASIEACCGRVPISRQNLQIQLHSAEI